MIDQKNQLKEVTQCKKCLKTAAKVLKKLTTFEENIYLEKFQPYVKVLANVLVLYHKLVKGRR